MNGMDKIFDYEEIRPFAGYKAQSIELFE